MGRLAGIPTIGNAGANQTIEPGKIRAVPCVIDGLVEYFQQQIKQLVIFRRKFAGAYILGEVGPITIDANPDFEQRRLVLLNLAIARGSKRSDSLSRPDQSKGTCHFYFS